VSAPAYETFQIRPGGAGIIEVILRYRDFGDPFGPKHGTIALIGYNSSRCRVRQPDDDGMSDNGGPKDQAWARFRQAELDLMLEILELAKPRIMEYCTGTWPAQWTQDRNAGCSSCPCTPGLVGDKRIKIGEHVIDLHITDNRR
jgi:hypothetical protein